MVERGNKYKDYTLKQSVRKQYSGDLMELVAGNSLVGEFVDIVPVDHGRLYIFDTDRKDGNFDKIFGCKTLDQQMDQIQIGTVVEISYNGEKKSIKNNRKYHDFSVYRLNKVL